MPHRTPGRHAVAAVVISLISLLVAGPAWADDAVDDPDFNGSGSVYVPVENGVLDSDVVLDEAPDGTLVSVAGADINFGKGSSDALIVTRLSRSGAVLDTDTLFVPDFGDVYDVEALANGNAVIAHSTEFIPGRGSFGSPMLLITVVGPDGQVVTDDGFGAPDACVPDVESPDERSAREDEPHLRTAEVAPSGDVYAAWDNCDELPVLARYSGLVEVMAQQYSVGAFVVELAIGPDGDVFTLAAGQFEEPEGGSRRFPFGQSLVLRSDGITLDEDAAYGNDGANGAIVPGEPHRFTVDASDRAVVWTSSSPETTRRGGGNPWHVYRFTPEGDPDDEWGLGGYSRLEHADFRGPWNAAITTQADGKVILVGSGPQAPDRGLGGPVWVIARTTPSGGLDPDWSDDGVRGFDPSGPGAELTEIDFPEHPIVQSDGKLLMPYGIDRNDPNPRVPVPSTIGESVGTSRIGLSPAAPPAQQQQQQQQAASPPPAAPTVAASTSRAARTCKSRRTFTIRLRTGRKKADRSPIVSAVVRVNGKRVSVSRRARRTARVNLKELPRGRFTVDIRLRLKDGGTVRDVRRYRTCTRKIERELAPLRTTPPRR